MDILCSIKILQNSKNTNIQNIDTSYQKCAINCYYHIFLCSRYDNYLTSVKAFTDFIVQIDLNICQNEYTSLTKDDI